MSVQTVTVGDGSPETIHKVVKRMFWLGWKACGGALGMGIFQDEPGATEDEVFANVENRGDYPGMRGHKLGNLSGDYVFGRMMKLDVSFSNDDGTVSVSGYETDIEYQSWSGKYPTYMNLLEVAAKSLDIEVKLVEESSNT